MSSGDKLSDRMEKLVSWSKSKDNLIFNKENNPCSQVERATINNIS